MTKANVVMQVPVRAGLKYQAREVIVKEYVCKRVIV